MKDISKAPVPLRGLYEGFLSGDIDAALKYLADEVEWVEHFPFPGVFRSPTEVAAVFHRVGAEFDHYDMSFERILSDNDGAVVTGRYSVRKPGVTSTFHSPFAHVYELRDDLVIRYEGLLDTAEAQRIFGQLH